MPALGLTGQAGETHKELGHCSQVEVVRAAWQAEEKVSSSGWSSGQESPSRWPLNLDLKAN